MGSQKLNGGIMALDKHHTEVNEGDEVIVRFRVVNFEVSSQPHNKGHMNAHLESVEGVPPNGAKAKLTVDARQIEKLTGAAALKPAADQVHGDHGGLKATGNQVEEDEDEPAKKQKAHAR
jgi:hypothetical protein